MRFFTLWFTRSYTLLTVSEKPFLFCFGLGFSASALARRLLALGWRVAGTSQRPVTVTRNDGVMRFPFRRNSQLPPEALAALAAATHLLVSVPPDPQGDAVLDLCRRPLAEAPSLKWIGYLSSTSVYGHTGGGASGRERAAAPEFAPG